jgi:hypothetical protein
MNFLGARSNPYVVALTCQCIREKQRRPETSSGSEIPRAQLVKTQTVRILSSVTRVLEACNFKRVCLNGKAWERARKMSCETSFTAAPGSGVVPV